MKTPQYRKCPEYMIAERMKVEISFMTEALGTAPARKDIYDRFVASKAPDALSRDEELATIIDCEGIDGAISQNTTIFPRNEFGDPFIWDYQIQGFFKEACGALRRDSGTKSSKVKAYKKVINELVFIAERQTPINLADEMGICQRPLRADTPQGQRVALASSETVLEGSTAEFEVLMLQKGLTGLVEEWLDYGYFHGMLQWRNGGKGRFEWRRID